MKFDVEQALGGSSKSGAFGFDVDEALGKKKKRERTWGEAATDTAVQLAEGVNTIAGAVPNLVAPESDTAEFFNRNADFWREQQSEPIKERIAQADQAIDKAGEDGVISQISEAAGQYFSDPVLAARFVTTNLPSMIPGLAATKLAHAAALARGASAARAAAIATTAGGATNAVLNAGGARGEAFEDIKRTLEAKGYSPEQAEQMALSDSRVSAAVGAVAGFISGKTGLEGSIVGKVGAGGALKAGGRAAIAELAGEQIEEVTPKLTTNALASEYDDRSIGKDVGRTIVETAIGSGPGSIVAGGASALEVRRNAQPSAAGAISITNPSGPTQGEEIRIEPTLDTRKPPATAGRHMRPEARLAELEMVQLNRPLNEGEIAEAQSLLREIQTKDSDGLTDQAQPSPPDQALQAAAAQDPAQASSTAASPALDAAPAPADVAAAEGVDLQAQPAGPTIAPEDQPEAGAAPVTDAAPTNFWSFAKTRGYKPGQIKVGTPEHTALKAEYDALRAGRQATPAQAPAMAPVQAPVQSQVNPASILPINNPNRNATQAPETFQAEAQGPQTAAAPSLSAPIAPSAPTAPTAPTALPAGIDPALQNRDRSRAASVAQMADIARNPDYMRLATSRTPDAGAPMVFAVGDDITSIPEGNEGRTDVAVMADGQRVPFRYAVVDARTVEPSNFADGRANPAFSAEVMGTIKALNNGRTAGLRAAYEQGTAGNYQAELIADAAAHGVSAEAIQRTPNPILVRVYSERSNTPDMAAKSQGQGLGMSPAELARQDAPLFDAAVLTAYQPGDVTSVANRDFVRAFVGKLSQAGQDVAGMMTAEGSLSPAGRQRIQAGLMQAAYGDADLVAELFDSLDTEIKAIGESLKAVAGDWANMRDSARQGLINPEADITDNLLQAVNLVRKARRENTSLLDLVNQPDLMTGETPDELTVGALRFFYPSPYMTRAAGREAIVNVLRDYTRNAMGTTAGADMFGQVVTPSDILNGITEQGATNAQDPAQEGSRGTNGRGTDGRGPEAPGQGDQQPGADRPSRGTGADRAGERENAAGPAGAGNAQAQEGNEAGRLTERINVQRLNALRREALPIVRTEAYTKKGITFRQDGERTTVLFKGDPIATLEGKRTRDNIVKAIEGTLAQPGDILTAYTPQDVIERQDAAETAQRQRETDDRTATEQDRARQQRDEIRRRSEAAADTFELGQDPMANLTGQRDVFSALTAPEAQADVTATARAKLRTIADRLGIVINEAKGGFTAGQGMVNIPTEDAQVEGAISADHVAAHELGHAAMQKRGISFQRHPITKIKEIFIPNWNDLLAASKAFRPAVWDHENKKIKDHARKPDEVIADAIGSVYLGLSDVALLKPLMKGTGTTLIDLGLEEAAPSKPIEDAGQKIGGARKDRWKERGLNLDDLDSMTEAEGAELATKANVWKPDYEALAAQSDPVTAATVKVIYDRLAAKPEKNTPEGRRQYVEMMQAVRRVYGGLTSAEALKTARQQLLYGELKWSEGRAGDNEWAKRNSQGVDDLAAHMRAAKAKLFSVYKGRSDPFVLGFNELQRVKKMVADGFPAKGEPWKARLVVGRREGGTGTTERGFQMYAELSAEVGTPLTREQIEAGFFRVRDKKNKTVAFAPTKEDAEAAAKTIYERDMKGGKDGKPEPERPHLDEIKRENLPQRIDRDVTAEDFIKDLGFRGVEFGNWSAQDERQRILNMAYDGLTDLAEIMGVPPKAMSLNGTLGMAFGARGGGRFAAHYEPGKLVINMTKIRGGGSMAHEWAHAMDHYFGELDKADAYTTQARGASGWLTEDQYKGIPRKRMERIGNEWKSVEKMRLDNLRPELARAFDEVMQALFQKQMNKAEMVRSSELDLERTQALVQREQDAEMKAMYQRMAENQKQALEELRKDPEDTMYFNRGRSEYAQQAQALSGKSTNGYWTRPTEMFARAFESWVFDRVTAMGARSDYLVHGVEEDRFAGGDYKGNPYPTGEERARINAAFEKLAKTIKTKETDKGLMLYEPEGIAYTGDRNERTDRQAAEPAGSARAGTSPTDTVRGERGAVPGRARITGLGISADIQRAGSAALIGRTVSSADELADLAQVYRDPRYETFRVFFTRSNRILHANGVSARLPGQTPMIPAGMSESDYIQAFKDQMADTGADGYYILHNHPSGDPTPSRDDQRVTEYLAAQVPGMKAHVVINSNRYAVIRPGEAVEVKDKDFGDDLLRIPSLPSPILNAAIGKPDDLVTLGKSLQKPGWLTLIGTDSTNKVRLTADVPASALSRDPRVLAGQVRRLMRQSGSRSMYLVGSDADVASQPVQKALRQGILRDAVGTSGRTQAERGIGGNGDGFSSTSGRFVAEGRYRDQDQTQTPEFKRWFGNSEVVDADGKPLVVYHGTGADIAAFDPEAEPNNYESDRGKFFFTSDSADAAGYAETASGSPNVVPVYLSLQNPRIDETDLDPADWWDQQPSYMWDMNVAQMGHDGLIVRGGDGKTLFVASRPTQIKSAIGNNGQFDPGNPSIVREEDSGYQRDSIGSNPPPQPGPDQQNLWTQAKAKVMQLTSPAAIDRLIYEFQDKYIDLKRLRDHIKSIGGTITDLNDAYLGEELYHKRLAKRTEDFLDKELKPLLADMRSRSVALPELERYLHARHAAEANRVLAQRNPNRAMIDAGKAESARAVRDIELKLQRAKANGSATKAIEEALAMAREEAATWNGAQAFRGTEDERLALSGMTDAEAKAFMASLTPRQRQNFQELAERVDAIQSKTLKTLEGYGLMDKATLTAWRDTYQFYVPLHRDEAGPESDRHPIGQGFSVKGTGIKSRVGSNEKVTNILAHIAMQRETALTRGEKNHVVKKLYLMAAQNPDGEFWEIDQPPMTKTIDPRTGFVRTGIDPTYKNKPNVVMVRIAGRDQAIVFNEQNPQAVRLAEAMKNLDVGDLHVVLGLAAKGTRWFASVNTQYNPIFGLINFARDVQAGLLNLSTTELAGKQKEVASHVMTAMRAIYRERRGKGAINQQWTQLWDEFQDVGGTTGYRDLFSDAKDRANALGKQLAALDRGEVSKAAHAVVDWLSDYNETMENAVRLAAYKVALEQGMTKERAASLAKNITVNFNRKGRQAREIGALYAFFNAALQGTARMVETLRGPVGKRIMYGGVMLGVVNTLIGMAMMGADDDDEADNWEQIPEFIKERSIVIPLGREDYATIPMPLGFHVFPNIGRIATEYALGDSEKSLGRQVGKLLLAITDAFNPLGGSQNLGQLVAPTVIDPVVALMQNRDWTGKPIYRENSNGLDPQPGHRMAKDSASTPSRIVAEAINRITGGTEYRPGAWSPTPDQLDYVIGQLTGGLGRELLKVNQSIAAPFTGDELPPYKIPLVGRLYGNTRGPAGQSERFYDNIKLLNEIENEYKGRLRNQEDVEELRNSEPLLPLVPMANQYENHIRKLRNLRRQIVERKEDGYQARAQEIDQQIGAAMADLNKAISKARKEAVE